MNTITKNTGKKWMMMLCLYTGCITVAAHPAICMARYAYDYYSYDTFLITIIINS